ncbi:MFS transporter [Archangium sp.]|uniref:MFS transporter n=1 Tax=Archangium sp. TaxID=1872627 RepID=UPI003899D67F
MTFKTSYKVGLAVLLCYLVAWLDRMAINMAGLSIRGEFQLDAEQFGWVLSAFFAGYSLFQIPGGMLADRIGPRKVILVALAWWSVFTALTGVVGGFVSMLAVRFLFGVGEGVFPASVWKVIGNWYTKKNRGTANAAILSSIAFGPAISSLLLGWFLPVIGWRKSFFLLGIAGVICVLMAWLYVTNSIHENPKVSREELEEFERDSLSQAANAEQTLEKASFGELLRSPAIWVLFCVALIYNLTMYGWLNWLPTYLVEVKKLSLQRTGFVGALPFFCGGIGCVLAGYVSDRWFRGRRKVLVFGCQAVGGICLYLFTQINDPVQYTLVQCIAGFLLFMAAGAFWTLPMILVPTKLMGKGSGFINTGGQIGGFITNILIGYVIKWNNNDAAAGFHVMLGALVVAALLVLFGIREQPASAPAKPSTEPALS